MPEAVKRNAYGQFQKGEPSLGGRKKGSKNKVSATVHGALNKAAATLGAKFVEGDEDALEAFFTQVGKEKLETLANYLVRSNVPRATAPEVVTNPGATIDTVIVQAIPHGQFTCTFEESEVLRKLKAFPDLLSALFVMMNAAMYADIPPPVEMSTSDGELLARMSRLPGMMSSLRLLLIPVLAVAEEQAEKRKAREPIDMPKPDMSNVAVLRRSPDGPSAA